ncbi:proton-conducting transporter membrane subunit [Parahaliea mediterranea]|uniref:Monovalent cation/H+ antiporter subunit D family protein n=1 Tax=Parahaliea mediterranea TaxID=651086 RepID=A0A939DFL4_9GAMM|nr:proton-conducting transporter membrane subunit [Parahaliea mediterranea]MBN7797215.1 monovalent cation/H+ antiporter subunit D family protein [Parahaliea mediterranea]
MSDSNGLLLASLAIAPLAILGIVLLRSRPNWREGVSVLASIALFAVNIGIYHSLQQGATLSWRSGEILPGLRLELAVEPLGALFALIASFLWLVTVVYAVGYMRGHGEQNQTRFYAFFALSIGCVMGVAFSGNLLTLFLFYEMLSLSTWPLVVHAGNDKARHGGRVYLGVLLGTSIVFFLPAIILTWWSTGSLSFVPGGLFPENTDPRLLSALLVLFVFGVGKAAMMPFHRWLPAAMVAPTPVSALLHAVAVVKAGVFSLVKIGVYVFGLDQLAAVDSREWLLYLAGFTLLAASIVAMQKDNLKARLAYSTVSQLAYVTLGVLLAVPDGVTGSGLHIAMHAFGKITLFFCAGAILVASHKTEVSQLRGLGRQMPFTMAAFLLASLSIAGLPPTGGTWSKWFLMLGTLDTGALVLTAALVVSSLLNIVYLTLIPVRAFWRFDGADEAAAPTEVREAPLACCLAIGVTTAICVALFLFPQPLYELVAQIPLGGG